MIVKAPQIILFSNQLSDSTVEIASLSVILMK